MPDERGLLRAGRAARPRRAVRALVQAVEDAEPDFALTLWTPADAVAHAARRGAPGAPVVLADTQDNPGAGGNGDTTGLLAAMIEAARARRGARPADRPGERGAGASARAGRGRRLPARRDLRRRRAAAGGRPVRRRAAGRRPVHLHRADVQGLPDEPGRHGAAARASARACAWCSPRSSARRPTRRCSATSASSRVRQRIVALKSSVHFRADFQPIASEVLVVRAPGPALADPADFPWRRLRPGPAARPLGPGVRRARGAGEPVLHGLHAARSAACGP